MHARAQNGDIYSGICREGTLIVGGIDKGVCNTSAREESVCVGPMPTPAAWHSSYRSNGGIHGKSCVQRGVSMGASVVK